MVASIAPTQTGLLSKLPPPDVWNRITEIFKRTASSPLFWATMKVGTLIGISITSLAFPTLLSSTVFTTILGAGFATLGVEVYLLRKPLAYEAILCYELLNNSIHPEKQPWWSRITDQIILGAIPLKNKGHIEQIEAEGVSLVLSLLELFEFAPKMFTVPAKHLDWSERNINHRQIPAADFTPVPLYQLDEAVETMRREIEAGGTVYIHCKSGVGRSAMVVAAYLLKYHAEVKSVQEAYAYIKARRPQVYLNSKQLDILQQYYNMRK